MTASARSGAPTISERLADYAVTLRFEDIPPDVVERAKLLFAHLLGSAFRGYGVESSRRAIDLACDLSGAEAGCTIVGESRRANVLDAAFANSFLIASLGYDDFQLPQGAHPGVVAQPVAWSFGETARTSGRELLTAVVVAYDVLGRLCDPTLTWGLEVFRPATFVLQPFGAVAAAARIMRLSHAQTTHAFGHAGQVGICRTETGDGRRTIHPLLARNSGMAALLARSGIPAASTVFEGEQGVFRTFFARDVPASVEAALATLGEDFAIASVRTKQADIDPDGDIPRHPAIIPVELTRSLLSESPLEVDDVVAVTVVLAEGRRVREIQRDEALLRPDADGSTRRASLRFQIAILLADGRTDPSRYEDKPDPDLLAVLERIRLRFEPGHPLLYTRVEVATTAGGRHVVVDDGDTDVPPPADAIDWLTTNGRTVLPVDRLTRLVELVSHLEEVPDVAEVMACAVPAAAS
jgi:2-methylcitrate dehydratase PrpD